LSLNRNLTFNDSSSPAITFDAASSAAADGWQSSITFAHTTGSGNNRILMVGVSTWVTETITSVTYNGTNLTKLASEADVGQRVDFWYLKNPAVGTYNIVVTGSNNMDISAGATTWFNVNQVDTFGTPVGESALSTASQSVNVTSTTGEVVIDHLATVNVGTTVGADQTERYNRSGQIKSSGSSEPGAATVTMSWTFSQSNNAILAVPLKPAGSTLAIEGSMLNIASQCTQTAGSCTDNSSLISLNQQFTNASGSVLSVLGAGTGTLAAFDASNTAANGINIDIQSSNVAQYALNVTANNGATNALSVRGSGNVGIGTTAPTMKLQSWYHLRHHLRLLHGYR
jgi:hypothetical protein